MKREGMRLVEEGCLEEAKAVFDSICRNTTNDAEAWFWLGRVYGKLGEIDAAGDCCRRAIGLRPEYCEAHVNLGKALMLQGKHEEAIASYQTVLQIDSQNAEAYTDLGNIWFRQGKYEDAAKCYETVVRLKPQSADAFYNLGNIKRVQKIYTEAISCYEKAIFINPNMAAAYNNLGAALYEQGEVARAISNYQHALGLDPNYAEVYNNLGIILKGQGYMVDAERMFIKTMQLNPELIEPYLSLGAMRNRQGDAESAMELFQKALAIAPSRADIQSSMLMTMCYLPEYSSDTLFAAARQWAVRHKPERYQPFRFLNNPNPARRLRIGYVSGDFNAHPVSYFIEPVLIHHDRSGYEVFCYYNKIMCDEYTRRLQACSDHWVDIAGQSDEAVLQQIQRDSIDVLVDLSGHTAENRLPVFAHKAAPVQATWMGYFATTGMEAMDYIIADRCVIPRMDECLYVEQVVRLPHCYLCFSPPRHPIDVSPLPALTAGTITFGCFNNPAKLSPALFDCWLRLMRAVPHSRLFIKYRGADSDTNQKRYKALFENAGIGSDRLRLSGYSPREGMLAAYHEVDIALDPFPYNGGTTTAEALWMGVPVITLRGDRFAGRVGESILTTMGLDEFVVNTEEDYITRAAALADDLNALSVLRATLREKMLDSPLCDGAAFTASLQDAYRHMWRTWCRTQ